jgi:hypothetical protein
VIGHLYALLLAQAQQVQPPQQAGDADAQTAGHHLAHRVRRSRAVPGWALPALNQPIEPTADQKAARTRRQLRQLRMLRRV